MVLPNGFINYEYIPIGDVAAKSAMALAAVTAAVAVTAEAVTAAAVTATAVTATHSITFFIVNRPGVLGVPGGLGVLGVWGSE